MKDDQDYYFPFVPKDWSGEVYLKLCSFAAKGCWIDMLAIAFELTPRGVLPGNIADLSALLGKTPQEVAPLVAELERRKVFTRGREVRQDARFANWDMSELADDCIVNRRMYREWKIRRIRAEAGSKGGLAKAGKGSGKSDCKFSDVIQGVSGSSPDSSVANVKANAEQRFNYNSNSNSRHLEFERGCGGKLSKADREKSFPEPVGDLVKRVLREDPAEELAGRIVALTREPQWEEWWREVLRTVTQHDGEALSAVLEAVEHCENATDPVKRATKDVGKYRDGRHGARHDLVKRVTAILKAHRLRWPDFPSGAKARTV